MKAQQKTLLASVTVLAIILSSFGSITYSWFTDVEEIDIGIGTASLDVSVGLTSEDSVVSDDTVILKSGSTATFQLTIRNGNDVPVDVRIDFVIPRYAGYEDIGTGYLFELRKDGTGYAYDQTFNNAKNSGNMGMNHRVVTVNFGATESPETIFSLTEYGGNYIPLASPIQKTIDGVVKTANYVHIIELRATWNMIVPANTMKTLDFEVDTTDKPNSSGETDRYTVGATPDPKVVVTATQPDSVGQPLEVYMVDNEDALHGEMLKSQWDPYLKADFLDPEGNTVVSIGNDTLSTNGLKRIVVDVVRQADAVRITISGFDSETGGAVVELDGWITYSLDIGDRPPTYLHASEGPLTERDVAFTLTSIDGVYRTTFVDDASSDTHTIGLYGGT